MDASVKVRKKPRQERSRETVEAILDATAQVLVSDGFAGVNTNRVAQRAGVSVGSIYQYFPNKSALVMAVTERHGARVMGILEGYMVSAAEGGVVAAVRQFIRAMFAIHAVNPRLHRQLTEAVLHLGTQHVTEVTTAARRVVSAYLAEHRDEIAVVDVDTASFLMVTMVEAVSHAALIEFAGPVDVEALEEEMVAMLLRYLGVADAEQPAPHR